MKIEGQLEAVLCFDIDIPAPVIFVDAVVVTGAGDINCGVMVMS
jgi:hypothetical protein